MAEKAAGFNILDSAGNCPSNVTTNDDTLRLVFQNGLSNQGWSYGNLHRWLSGHLRKAKVRHRGPNHYQHTLASQMLSNFVSLEWVAHQLGHAGTTTVKKHYALWIRNDTPNMAAQMPRMLGYYPNIDGQKTPNSAQ